MSKPIGQKFIGNNQLIIQIIVYSIIPTSVLSDFSFFKSFSDIELFTICFIFNLLIKFIIPTNYYFYLLNIESLFATLYLIAKLNVEIYNLPSYLSYLFLAIVLTVIVLTIFFIVDQRYIINLLAVYLIISFNLLNSQPVTEIDIFHEGEWLAPASFIQNNLIPYKDFLPIHGALKDGILPFISFKIFGTTVLSARLFDSIVTPILISIGVFLLLRAVLRVTHPIFVLIYLLIDQSWIRAFYNYSDARYIPLAYMALATFYSYKNPNKKNLVIFVIASYITMFFSPELIIFVGPANFLLLIRLYLLCSRKTFKDYAIIYVALNMIVLFLMFLSGVLSGIFDLIFRFSSNLWLVGGVPLVWENMMKDSRTILYMYATTFIILFLYLFYRSIGLKKIDSSYYWKLLIFISLALSFSKFITRMGDHIYETLPYVTLSNIIIISLIYSYILILTSPLKPKLQKSMTYLEIPMIIALVMVLGVPQIINTSNEGKQIYANRIGYITQEYKSDKQFMDFKNLKKDTKELVDEGYRFLDFSNSPVATYYYSQLPPASKFLTMTAAAQPTTQRFIINELKNTKNLAVIWSGPGFRYWDYISNTVRNYELSNYIINDFEPYIQRSDGFEIWIRKTDLRERLNNQKLFNDASYSCDYGQVPNNYIIRNKVEEVQIKNEETQFGLKINGKVSKDLIYRDSYIVVKDLDKTIAFSPLSRHRNTDVIDLLIPLKNIYDSALTIQFVEMKKDLKEIKIEIKDNEIIGQNEVETKDVTLKFELKKNLQSKIMDSSQFDYLKIISSNSKKSDTKTVYLSGWVFNKDKTPITLLKVLGLNGELIASTEIDIERTDVAGAYGIGNQNLGFSIEFALNKNIKDFSIETEQGKVFDLSNNDIKKLNQNGIRYINPQNAELSGYIELLQVFEGSFTYATVNKGGNSDSISMKLIDDKGVYTLPNKGCEQIFREVVSNYYLNFHKVEDSELRNYELKFYRDVRD
jgi:hypothetical protein